MDEAAAGYVEVIGRFTFPPETFVGPRGFGLRRSPALYRPTRAPEGGAVQDAIALQ
jgi:hypothetical protein